MFNYFLLKRNNFSNIFSFLFYYSTLFYIVSLFIKDIPVITNVLMIAMFVWAGINSIIDKPRAFVQNNKINFGMILFFLLQLLSAFISTNIETGLSIIIQRLPLLVFPLIFCLVDYKKEIWEKMFWFYSILTVIASIAGFVYGIFNALETKDTGFMYNDNISSLLGKQAVYFALYCSIAVLFFVFHLMEKHSKNRIIILLAIIWLLFIVFMLASRAAMLGLSILFLVFVLSSILKKKKYLEGAIIILGLVVGIVVIGKFFPKTFNRFNGSTEINFTYENKNVENHFNAEYDSTKWNGTNTRLAIWTCAFEIWKENKFFGTALGDRNKSLMDKYQEKQFIYASTTNKNTHSQYIDILVSMGILGLMVFLISYFIFPIYIFIKEKMLFALSILILLAICMITENTFDRYQGLILIPFMLGLAEKLDRKTTE